MSNTRLAFLGAGNIAAAIVRGLVAADFPPAAIIAADPSAGQLDQLAGLGIETTRDNLAAVRDAEVVLLCVKPALVPEVAREIAGALRRDALVISVAAGVPTAALQGWLGRERPLVRCMPNTPATIGAGIAALHATSEVDAPQRELAERILGAVGEVVWVTSDAQIDIATALSGSGPAYFFYFMEAMESAGVRLGLDPATCRALVTATALGAAQLVVARATPPAELRAAVTSPGGTTQAALARMEALGLAALVDEAVAAACARAGELAREFG